MKHLTHRVSLLALVAVLPLWAGCDSDRPKETVVYGTVLDAQTGQPLKSIPFVMYTATSGPGSFRILSQGSTDTYGKFTARTTINCCLSMRINAETVRNEKYSGYSTGFETGRNYTMTFRLEPSPNPR